jgi:hypothetical protein
MIDENDIKLLGLPPPPLTSLPSLPRNVYIQTNGKKIMNNASTITDIRFLNDDENNISDIDKDKTRIITSLDVDDQSDDRLSKYIIPKDNRYINYLPDAVSNFTYLPSMEKPAKIRLKSSDLLQYRKGYTYISNPIENNEENKSLIEKYNKVYMESVKEIKNYNNARNIQSYVNFKSTDYYKSASSPLKIPVISANDLNLTTSNIKKYCKETQDSNYKYAIVPQRHVDVSLMKDRKFHQTNYRGPVNLNPEEYLKKNKFVDNFEFQ